MDLKNTRVLITGANGFIGGRLAERLVDEEGARVRELVRRVGATLRGRPELGSHTGLPLRGRPELGSHTGLPLRGRPELGSHTGLPLRGRPELGSHTGLPQQTILGDLTDADAVRRAVDGCAVIIHCAAMQGGSGTLADFRRVNVDGTLNLLRAARAANVARFIHISTINVHGFPPPRDANADSPLVFTGDSYSVSKAEGERAAWQFARENNLPLTVIRPACTYGPRSEAWTMQPLRRVRRGAPVLIGKGDGICNAVFIDNLVDLILLALKNDAATGQTFIGAEGRGVTWREFYGAYARMAGISNLNALPRWVALAAATGFAALARVTGAAPRLSRASVEFYSHRVVYDIAKSKRLLGYAPRVSFEEGMRQTEEWLVEVGREEENRTMTNGK